MSTRASIAYNEETGVHIYMEMNDDNAIYIEVRRNGIDLDCRLMSFDEWKARGLPTQYMEPAIVHHSES